MIAEGDLVSVRMTARYTHKGEFMGIAPTNRAVTVTKFDWFRFSGGKCVAHGDSGDQRKRRQPSEASLPPREKCADQPPADARKNAAMK